MHACTRGTADSRRAAPAEGIFLGSGFPTPKPGSHPTTHRSGLRRSIKPAVRSTLSHLQRGPSRMYGYKFRPDLRGLKRLIFFEKAIH